MLHKSPGIVLRTVKYGESSVIVSIFTELFGVQSYMVNGARSSKPKANKGNLLQPGNILDMVIYHQEGKGMQRISEYKLLHIYTNLQVNVVKNTVALYLIELLQKSLRQPESTPELFEFAVEAFKNLDRGSNSLAANIPLYFTLQLATHLGFGLANGYSSYTPFLDLREGHYLDLPPHHTDFLDAHMSGLTDQLQSIRAWEDLEKVTMSKEVRRKLLYAYLDFFKLHLSDFPIMQSPPILNEILS